MNILDSTVKQDFCKENQLVIDNFTTEVVWIENSWSTFRIWDKHYQNHFSNMFQKDRFNQN